AALRALRPRHGRPPPTEVCPVRWGLWCGGSVARVTPGPAVLRPAALDNHCTGGRGSSACVAPSLAVAPSPPHRCRARHCIVAGHFARLGLHWRSAPLSLEFDLRNAASSSKCLLVIGVECLEKWIIERGRIWFARIFRELQDVRVLVASGDF